MRITSSYIYQKNLSDYQSKMYAYSKINEQLGSGLKIGQSYDDAGIYSEHIRLDYELSTFDQIIQAGESAVSFTKNSDNAVKQIKDALVSFKNKLIQSANEIHSDTSLNALANDLEKLKEHIVNLTNTSINGQYLFSGTSINTKPFDYNGNYYGNDENMKVLLGSNVYTPYNVSGSELIKATDNDYKKIVTTNVRLVDKRYDITKPEQVHYITSDNKIQDLVGKNYLKKESKDELNVNDHFLINDGAKFPDTYFYVNGTKGNGESFKAKFQMKATESVGSLLDKIGELYGNTKENTLVKVELTKTGNIEITDLKNPNSTLNFSMFAATNKADSIEEIYPDKAAQTDAEIEDIKNKAEDGAENTPMVNLKPAIKKNYADVSSLADLRAAQIKDNVDILEFTNNGNIDTSFNTDGIDYARSLFNKKDNILSSNIRQYDANNNLATDSTRLSESALSALKYHDDGNADTNSVLKIDITSRSKTRYNLEFDITKGEVRASFTKNGQAQNITLPIVNSRYDEALHKDESTKTDNIDITYKQLSDVIALFASDNVPTKSYELQDKYPNQANSPKILSDDDNKEYQQLLQNAKNTLKVGLNDEGKLQIIDKASTNTPIDIAIYDKNAMSENEFDFGTDADGNKISTGVKKGNIFNFNTNSSLIVDENHVDIIKDLQTMIDAVRNGNYRADNNNPDYLKNPGIQAALIRIDHLFDHVNKVHTKIGATQTSIEANNERATAMHLNIEIVKSSVSDADPALAVIGIQEIMQTLQSTMYVTSQIQKLSLLSYM